MKLLDEETTQLLRIKGPKIRRAASLTTIFVSIFTLLLFSNYGFVSAFEIPTADAPASQADIDSFQTDSPWYDPTACGANVASATLTVGSGSAADALGKVSSLDPQWKSIIISDSSKAGADPLMLAALFFWEHRGFIKFGDGRGNDDSDSTGRGPWQFTREAWPSNLESVFPGRGSYEKGVYDPEVSTYAAAQKIKADGGVPGIVLGSLKQDFGRNNNKPANLPSAATVAKNYNAGSGTWREPGVADYLGNAAHWKRMSGGSPSFWAGDKQHIIDDYIAGVVYVYYQMATGTAISFQNTDQYVKEALANDSKTANFKLGDTNTAAPATATPATTPVSTTTPSTGGGGKTVVVIDPGHSGKINTVYDTATGIKDYDYPNVPEIDDMWDVSTMITEQLTKLGYEVVNTKKDVHDTVTLRQRAEVANSHHAAIAVSLHDQGGQGGLPFSKNNYVYKQEIGLYRQKPDGSKYFFENNFSSKAEAQDVADKSATYAQNIASARTKAEGHDVKIRLSEDTRGDIGYPGNNNRDLAPGNIWLVQLWSKSPWLYNEGGGKSDSGAVRPGGLSKSDMEKYATGVVNGIVASVPPIGGGGTSGGIANASCGTASNGDIAGGASIKDTALMLAWHHYIPGVVKKKSDARQEYQVAMPKYNFENSKLENSVLPNGQDNDPWSDCGVFVATVMQMSGADKSYPLRGTAVQMPYLEKMAKEGKYELHTDYNREDQLHPGDILIFNGNGEGHTYLYVGPYDSDAPPGRDGKIIKYSASSASWHHHIPYATGVDFDQGSYHFTVARLLKPDNAGTTNPQDQQQ